MGKILKIAFALVSVLAVTASFSQEVVPLKPLAITEARNAAVGYALSQAVFSETMLRMCRNATDKPGESEQIYAVWYERNRLHLEASAGWVIYIKTVIKAQRGEVAATSFEQSLGVLFTKTGESTATDMFSKGKPVSAVCHEWLRRLEDPRFDVSASAQFSADLNEILAFHQAVMRGAR